MRAIASSGCSPSHSSGKPPTSTSGARSREALPRRAVGLDQQRDALDRGEAPDVEQHRALVAGQRGHVLGPLGAAVDLERVEELGVEAVVDLDALLVRRRPAAARRARPGSSRARSAARSAPPSRASARPTPSACAQRSGSSSIASSISSSVPCRCPTTGTSGATRAAASLSGVRWCRCSTSASRAPAAASARPQAVDQVLGDVVAQRGEHAVRRALAVLEGGVERRVGEQRVGRVERGGEVDRVHVEAAIERARVAGASRPRQRAGHDARLPARARQRMREVAGDVRGAAAREEHQAHEDAVHGRNVSFQCRPPSCVATIVPSLSARSSRSGPSALNL